MRGRILLVDGDTTAQAALVNTLSGLGYQTTLAFDGADAIARLRGGGFDLCFTDVRLPGPDIPMLDGYAVLRQAQAQTPPVPVVLLAGPATIVDAVSALRAGAVNFLPKPFHLSAVEEIVRRVFDAAARYKPSGRPTPDAAVIGEHPAMRAVLDKIDQVADTDASVLIRGETGTGKEVIARLIHASSRRSSGPFVAVNMAAIPEALAESELFGHVRGAFTGAEKPRMGRFLAAHRGTLFFDEIGEMPRNLQAKLLRVLQDHEVTPVGSSDQISADVRVIAATHRNLEEMVADGTFRADLYYRLEVVPMEVPPLRARRDDIPALADHFRREVNAREGRTVPGFSPAVRDRLCVHDWPGNVRELENLVQRLVVVASCREVTLEDLPPHMRLDLVDLESGHVDLPSNGLDLRMLLGQLEDRLIGQALARTGGNKNRAAELLGMNRTTLVEKLRRRNVA
ncbi:MAG: sigma-54 dependent transcriptional regulator [Pseudomonadota bacterium]